MVYKVDGNPQLDSRDWSMYTNILKMPTCTHTGRFISVPLCPGQSQLACICLFVQFNNQLDV